LPLRVLNWDPNWKALGNNLERKNLKKELIGKKKESLKIEEEKV